MRIRVKDVLDMLACGANEGEILKSYPYLEREDIQASLEYAAAQVDHAVLSLANTTNAALRTWIEPRLPGIVELVRQGHPLVEVI
jgi:hypothetical protein